MRKLGEVDVMKRDYGKVLGEFEGVGFWVRKWGEGDEMGMGEERSRGLWKMKEVVDGFGWGLEGEVGRGDVLGMKDNGGGREGVKIGLEGVVREGDVLGRGYRGNGFMGLVI